MDLRTKLVFALVGASLVGMLALGALAYTSAEEHLTAKSVRQLSALAETKEVELENVVRAWHERVLLIASRTQLRLSLREHGLGGERGARSRIRTILRDALDASRTVVVLTVYGEDGGLVASVGAGGEGSTGLPAPPGSLQGVDSVSILAVSFARDADPRVELGAPLRLDGERIGTLRVVLTAEELVDVTGNYTGLGRTGETLIVARDTAGRPRVLNPYRHGRGETPAAPAAVDGDGPAARALRGEEGPFTEGLVDYRGEPVWAATRFLPGVGWGLVVKIDADEERAPILDFRRSLTRLGFSLSALAILVGTLLGLRLATPIHELAGVADRIRRGELDARAEVRGEDEIGLLARTFNEMADELEERMRLLQEYRKFFDVSLDMLCIAGTDGYFKRVNPAFERTLGWSTEELLSRPIVDFVHPDDRKSTIREIEKLSEGTPTISFRNRYILPDGGYTHMFWKAYPDPETGRIYAVAREVSPAAGSGSGAGTPGVGPPDEGDES